MNSYMYVGMRMRISPAAINPTTILSHGWLHPVNHLWLREITPTQEHHHPQSGWTTQFKGVTRFASTACSHKVHSWAAAVPGCWPSSKVTSWCSLCPCRSQTSTTMKAGGCAPLNPATRRGHPCVPHVYVLAHRMHQKPVDFFPKNLLYVHVSGDFHTLGPFPERAVVFQQRPSNQIGRTCPTFGVKMSTKRNRSFTIKDIGYILSHFSQTYFHCLYDLKTSVFQVQWLIALL